MNLGVSYIPSHQPDHIQADFEYICKIGCNDVLLAFQENHFKWLNGAVRFGPKIAKQYGLRPRAVLWGFANTSGGGRSSQIMLENPGLWRCDRDGRPFSGGYPHPQACYNNPDLAGEYLKYVGQCRTYGIEEILIDEPTIQTCFCQHCCAFFEQEFGGDLRNMSLEDDKYKAFQKKTVLRFLTSIMTGIKVIDCSLATNVCVMPCDRQLFAETARIENLDVLGVDPYWLRPVNNLTFEDAVNVSKEAKKQAKLNNKRFELYLGCFGIRGGCGLEEKIYQQGKELVREVGPDILTTWSYKGGLGLAGEEECDNPELAWASVVRLYSELSHLPGRRVIEVPHTISKSSKQIALSKSI